MPRRSSFRRRQQGVVSLIVLVATLVIWLGQSRGWFGGLTKQAAINEPGLYRIDHFIDGDTIAVNMNGKVEEIRFIGIDTPETHKPNTPVQCYGPEAAARTKQLISDAGSKVRLGSDPDSTNRDRYDRLLRYIYLPDGTLLQDKLLAGGYAFYYPYFPFTKAGRFQNEATQAMAAKNGLWGACQPTPSDDGGYKMNEPEPANLSA